MSDTKAGSQQVNVKRSKSTTFSKSPNVVPKAASASDSDADSDLDPFTADLDQVGRFNIPDFSAYLNKDNLPEFPNFANLPNLPNLPSLPNLPNFNGFVNLPNLANFPNLPNLPDFSALPVPSPLAEVSRYITQLVNTALSHTPDSEASVVHSLKTAVAMRIQMNTFLTDLKSGQSLSAAIARLQPITELIHEAVTLPADDEDFVPEHDTEPEGVAAIVNREQPYVGELVVPETATIAGVLDPTATRRSRRRQGGKRRGKAGVLRENGLHAGSTENYELGSPTNTDLDTVDELTREEAAALTHLDSLDDFFQEDTLRRKIQRIHTRPGLSQHSKNKLVTKLMMGNYYKYLGEKLHTEADSHIERTEDRSVIPADSFADVVSTEGLPSTGEAPGNTSQSSTFSRLFGGNSVVAQTPDSVSVNAHNKGSIDNKGPISQEMGDLHRINESEVNFDEDMNEENDDESDEEDDDMEDEVVLTERDSQPSFHNKALDILGCQHYQRNCKLECPTCLKWYTCRFCHDADISGHKLARSDVKHILCMKCNTPQVPDTNYCVNCEEELANYFCLKCVLYDNDPSKDIYHCDKCGICRLGLGLEKDYFHCDTCNICLSIDLKEHHKCVSNTTHCNCPICSEYLFTSVSKVVFMKCGHSIHQSCYDEMIKHSYKCPVCKKTVVNTATQFRILDQEIRQSPLPSPYDKWRCIITCNDCKGKSNCAYHVMGLKCRYCASYNTNQLKLIKPEEAEEEGESGRGENRESFETNDEDSARITSMRLIKTNLSSHFLIDEHNTDSNVEGQTLEEQREKAAKRKMYEREELVSIFGDSAYEGDNNDEDAEDVDMAAIINMKRLTRAVLGERNISVDRTSISAMFQNFINATIMDDENQSDDESENEKNDDNMTDN